MSRLYTCNEDGYKMVVLDEIIGHRTDGSEVEGKDAFIVAANGIKRKKETTRGHYVLLKWMDGTSTWNTLKDVKDSYPVQLATYAMENKLDKLPAFAWWVPYVIRKRKRIIKKLKSKYWSRTHKYGIRIPKTVAGAIARRGVSMQGVERRSIIRGHHCCELHS